MFLMIYAAAISTKHVRTVSDVIRFRCSFRIDYSDCGSTRMVTGYEAARIGGVGSLEGLAWRRK